MLTLYFAALCIGKLSDLELTDWLACLGCGFFLLSLQGSRSPLTPPAPAPSMATFSPSSTLPRVCRCVVFMFRAITPHETGQVLPFVGPRPRFATTPATSRCAASCFQQTFAHSPPSYVLVNDKSQIHVAFKGDYPLVAGRTYHVTPKLEFADAVTQLVPHSADSFVPLTVNITSAPVVWFYNPRTVQEVRRRALSTWLSSPPRCSAMTCRSLRLWRTRLGSRSSNARRPRLR